MKKKLPAVRLDLGTAPLIEMVGNRRVTVGGSTGILLYETGCIKLSAGDLVLSFEGRGLCLLCVFVSCVEVGGFITHVDFLS